MLNMDQVDDMRARVIRGEFPDINAFMVRVMHLFRTSFDASVQSSLASMGFWREAERIANRRRERKDPHRSWVNGFARQYNLELRKPEPIEMKRNEFSIRPAFDRRS